MRTTKQPYELLVRWDLTGQLSGAQVQHRYVITEDDGAVVGASDAEVQPLTLDTAAGFPLGDLLTQAQSDALTAYGIVLAERDAALARVAELEAQISALQPAGAP